ncbi:MAG: cardiolipin synthase [Acidiferrobacterales bacterium]
MDTILEYLPHIMAVSYLLLEVVAILVSIEALLTARTPQGAIAWSLFLVMFPILGLPLYFIFGGRKFSGYADARRNGTEPLQQLAQEISGRLPIAALARFNSDEQDHVVLTRLARMPFFAHNSCRLLINGEVTFKAIFQSIETAQDYVLVQFFIIKDDELGRALQQCLVKKAREGVRVYFLYDGIGSHKLSTSYLQVLKESGVETAAFRGKSSGGGHAFRINFRNHRKIVVVDGHTAYVGGHNVGDEYVGKSDNPDLRPWRDTHVEVCGPAVLAIQLAFLEDWYWVTRQIPTVRSEPVFAETANQRILVLPSGPADDLDTCGLLFTELIHSARQRVWIVSPYFVPDDTVVSALQLAALRGVDVRIMLPEKPDHMLVYLARFSYLADTLPYGITVYSYQAGFLHQKVVLVDDKVAGIGTANLDNRSFRLNFEITLLFVDKTCVKDVQDMLQDDFSRCRKMEMKDIEKRPLWFKLATRIARLFSPIL